MRNSLSHILTRFLSCISIFPHFYFYLRARYVLRGKWVNIDFLFNQFLEKNRGLKSLQIGARGEKYTEDFDCVDLYDQAIYVDYNYDIHNLQFGDEEYDIVVCNAVLEHVENPIKAISELHRVLKIGGKIWIEVPMNQPYHPSPNDYWRVTLQGLEIWMKKFHKIDSGYFGNFFYNGVYYYGKKS